MVSISIFCSGFLTFPLISKSYIGLTQIRKSYSTYIIQTPFRDVSYSPRAKLCEITFYVAHNIMSHIGDSVGWINGEATIEKYVILFKFTVKTSLALSCPYPLAIW